MSKRRSQLTTLDLRNEALEAASKAGILLRHVGRSAIDQTYQAADNRTFKLRTSNDRVLTVKASTPDPDTAILKDIADVDFVLIAMPSEKRGPRPIEVYAVPTAVVEKAIRLAHKTWLETNPKTAGQNMSYSIWFDSAPGKAGLFGVHWREYRLQ